MKKAYIRPESCLFAINFAENIANGSLTGGTIEGSGNIHYDPIDGELGLFYTATQDAPVKYEPNEIEYNEYVDKYFIDKPMIALQLLYLCGRGG